MPTSRTALIRFSTSASSLARRLQLASPSLLRLLLGVDQPPNLAFELCEVGGGGQLFLEHYEHLLFNGRQERLAAVGAAVSFASLLRARLSR
jgi:hypothetical protein